MPQLSTRYLRRACRDGRRGYRWPPGRGWGSEGQAHLTAVVTAPVVALGGDNGLHGVEHVVLSDKAQRLGQAREGLVVAVGAAHAAADVHVAAEELALGVRHHHQALQEATGSGAGSLATDLGILSPHGPPEHKRSRGGREQ